MKNIFIIILIGFSLMGCGEDNQNIEKNSSVDLPKNEVLTKSSLDKTLQRKAKCLKKGGCEEDTSSNNDNSSNENSSDYDDNSIYSGNRCHAYSIEITSDDQDILDYNNPHVVYDLMYDRDSDIFCIQWDIFNNASLKDKILYSYNYNESTNRGNWNILKIDKETIKKGFIKTSFKDSKNHKKVYIKLMFSGYDNDVHQYVSGYFKIKDFTYNPKTKSEKDILLQESHKIAYGYYKDNSGTRWYISKADNSKKVTVYSLMPIKNGKAGWGVVGKDVASMDLDNNQITIGDISNSDDNQYYIAVQNETIASDKKQSDIEKIRNSTVSIDWWFFKASNSSWYIVNTDGKVYRFASKEEVDENGNKSEVYDWKKIDLDNVVPNFYIENGVKKVKF